MFLFAPFSPAWFFFAFNFFCLIVFCTFVLSFTSFTYLYFTTMTNFTFSFLTHNDISDINSFNDTTFISLIQQNENSELFLCQGKAFTTWQQVLILLKVEQNNKDLMLYIIALNKILIEHFTNVLYNINITVVIQQNLITNK